MKKRLLACVAVGVLVMMAGQANANLIVSGTVFYAGAERKLIWDDYFTITWLDYSNPPANWSTQQSWAANLSFTINGVEYDNWRLPRADWIKAPANGYYQTYSDMGHLYYSDLGLYSAPDRYYKGQGLPSGYVTDAELNATVFDNLVASWYWSGTEYVNFNQAAWGFYFGTGSQNAPLKNDPLCVGYGMAILPGRIEAAPVPEPASMLLMGIGIAGLAGSRLRRKKQFRPQQ